MRSSTVQAGTVCVPTLHPCVCFVCSGGKRSPSASGKSHWARNQTVCVGKNERGCHRYVIGMSLNSSEKGHLISVCQELKQVLHLL